MKVIGFFFCIFSAFIFWILKRSVRLSKESRFWPSVEGEIVHSEVEKWDDDDEWSSLKPKIEYQYEVEGIVHTGRQISFAAYDTKKAKQRAHSLVEKYPVSSRVQIFYNFSNPEQCVLEPGGGSEKSLKVIKYTICFFFIVGIFLLFS